MALANECIALLKETAVLSIIISVVEVTRKSMLWAAATFEAWPAYLGTAFCIFKYNYSAFKTGSLYGKEDEVLKR